MQRSTGNEGFIMTGGTINATNVAGGKGAKISTYQRQADEALAEKGLDTVRQRLDELIALIEQHGASLSDSEQVMESTAVVAQELARDKPNKITIGGILTSLAETVASATAVATAVHALKGAVMAFL